MIELEADQLLALLCTLPLTLLGILALLCSGRTMRRPSHEVEHISVCEKCGHVYAVYRCHPVGRCPRCRRLNALARILHEGDRETAEKP